MKNFKRFSPAILGLNLICSFFIFTSLPYHRSATASVTGLQLGPATQLTTNSANDIEPAWSPDGSTIAFISNRIVSSDGYDLFAINPDGTQERLLAQFTFTDTFGGRFGNPSWLSTTGDLLVAEFKSLHELMRFKLASAIANNALPVSRSVDNGSSPYLDQLLFVPGGQLGISPVTFNGSQIAWAALVDPLQKIWQVRFFQGGLGSFIGNTDSAGQSVFQTDVDGRIGYPEGKTVSFSPDGSKLCIAACVSGWSQGKRRDLYIIDLTTHSVQRITITGDQGQDNWSVAWSSQNIIAFASRPSDASNYDLYTIQPDGSGLTRLTQTSWNEIDPDWSPDGNQLAFASDQAGNYDVYKASIVISPDCSITCPANISVSNTPNQCGANVAYVAPTTTGNCGTVTCSPISGSFFPAGATTVTCTATAGPVCSFTVTVQDTQPPTINCPANVNVTAAVGQNCAVVNYPSPSASDNCGTPSVQCSPVPGSCFPVGVTTVTCTARDASKNNRGCNFMVMVERTLIDSDGDGIPDEWELHGYTYNRHFVDLPAMGAKANHKDIFVQVDYMTGHRPDQAGVIDVIRNSFARVPNSMFAIPNPDGLDGITLHVNVVHELPHVDQLGSNNGNSYNWSDFDAIKRMNFDEAVSLSFHYCIFAHNGPKIDGKLSSGIARDIPASDFLVTLGHWPRSQLLQVGIGEGGTDSEQAGTFMHELGHNLGLCHGGPKNLALQDGQCDINNKPNYLSVMNYAFQFKGLRHTGTNGLFDYSQFSLTQLNETHLDERIGLKGGTALNEYGTSWTCPPLVLGGHTENANGAINWNCNTDLIFRPIIEPDVRADINGDGLVSLLLSYNDWVNLNFRGGTIGAGAPFPLNMETPVNEIDFDTAKAIPPTPAAGITASFELDGVHLNWIPAGPISEFSYKVYRSVGGGPFTLLLSTASASAVDTNPALFATNSYYVTVVNTLGSESSPSDTVTPSMGSVMVVQDDSNSNIMRFSSTTGEYLWTKCNGFTLTGIGTLIIKGSIITLQHNRSDRRVLATVDNSVHKGTATAQVLPQGTTFTITDRNTTDDTFGCRVPGQSTTKQN